LEKAMITFDSKLEVAPAIMNDFTQEQVKNEPMLFNCDVYHALELGGPITLDFLGKLRQIISGEDFAHLVVDSRVHMLMPGWFACIPGFHHDDVPRTRKDGQPNYHNPEYKAKHCLAMINAEICPTEFAVGKADFVDYPDGSGVTLYKQWHLEMDSKIFRGDLEVVKAKSRRLYLFDWNTWHQGTRAVANGWRFFIRASWNTGRKPTNELRRQVQVYLENPVEGW
jgi:hypothetical protein